MQMNVMKSEITDDEVEWLVRKFSHKLSSPHGAAVAELLTDLLAARRWVREWVELSRMSKEITPEQIEHALAEKAEFERYEEIGRRVVELVEGNQKGI